MAVQFHPKTVPTDEEIAYLNDRNAPLRFERSLEGELVVTPPAGNATSRRNARLVALLTAWNDAHGYGKVYDSSGGFSLGFLRAPDAAWMSATRASTIPPEQDEQYSSVSPELVFEFISPSDRDRPAEPPKKAKEWVTAGVSLAVVLDPFQRLATVHTQSGALPPAYPTLTIDRTSLPGADEDLVLDLAQIFDA
ncbi:MAG: Uma2 family endonuclease [Vulcanimicrobiaceae bacterium]